MKTILLLLALFTTNAIAFEAVAAPEEVIKEYLELCKGYATEDEISDDELPSFLLGCVNQELESNGYQLVDSID